MTDYRALANCIRALSMDAVQRANSGHPGMPMGMADVATVLFADFIKYVPDQPQWADRDRFILSAGHGSMLLYALLYLLGYPQMDIEQIKRFRQWGSLTPGHPEYGHTPGVETTTGPLGQGLAMGVGMAIAEQIEQHRFGEALVNHRTYVIAGDGCLAEGISHEAASLAGHLKLSKLIVLFDDNGITIDGKTALSTSENYLQRFDAYGWNTIAIDGLHTEEIRVALQQALHSELPTLIACKTIIGYGSPQKQGTEKAHGSPLGEDEIAATREALEWPHAAFQIPEALLTQWRDIGQRHQQQYQEWQLRLADADSEVQHHWNLWRNKDYQQLLNLNINNIKNQWINHPPTIATRKASEETLTAIIDDIPTMIGGSADLTTSNNTKIQSMDVIAAENYQGNYLHYGVREHAMAAAMNGMALHGLTPYGGTFLVFSDYCRPAIRLSALLGVQVIYVMTHDSIGLGEDGPTHQPIEHLAALRAIPNLSVYRPADAVETAECWQAALWDKNHPSVIALSRQNTPPIRLTSDNDDNLCWQGAYVVNAVTGQQATILASGTEVALALQVAQQLTQHNIITAVVSFPCWQRFQQQDESYQKTILGNAPRFVIEAASAFGWERYAPSDNIYAMSSFGMSAPAKALFSHFGFDADTIAHDIIKKINSPD